MQSNRPVGYYLHYTLRTFDFVATLLRVGIPGEGVLAVAGGHVVDGPAVGPAAAVLLDAGVDALEVPAGLVLRAVRVDLALRAAARRSPAVARQAGAGAVAVALSLLAVGPAGVRVARVVLLHDGTERGLVALVGRISGVALEAGADGLLVDHVAHRIDAANSLSAGILWWSQEKKINAILKYFFLLE